MAQVDAPGSFSHLVVVKGSGRVAVIWYLLDLEYLPSSVILLFAGNFSSSLYEPHHISAHSMAPSRVSNERDREMGGRVGVGVRVGSKHQHSRVSRIEIVFIYKLISEAT